MMAIFWDAIDNGPYRPARQASLECKDGAYHETIELHGHMVLQVRDVLHRPVGLNIRVTPVSSTVKAGFGVILVECMCSLISPQRIPCASHRVTIKSLVGMFVWNLDFYDARRVAIHLPGHMHQSSNSLLQYSFSNTRHGF